MWQPQQTTHHQQGHKSDLDEDQTFSPPPACTPSLMFILFSDQQPLWHHLFSPLCFRDSARERCQALDLPVLGPP
jgi:hypothetical protein